MMLATWRATVADATPSSSAMDRFDRPLVIKAAISSSRTVSSGSCEATRSGTVRASSTAASLLSCAPEPHNSVSAALLKLLADASTRSVRLRGAAGRPGGRAAPRGSGKLHAQILVPLRNRESCERVSGHRSQLSAIAQGNQDLGVQLPAAAAGAARPRRPACGTAKRTERGLASASSLSNAALTELKGSGAQLSSDEAVELALTVPDSAGSREPELTARELQIAALITRGLSNRAIADELGIAAATVARHIANVMAKLGFTSRLQIAAWAKEHGSLIVEQRAH